MEHSTWVRLRGGQERLDRIAAQRAADEAYRQTDEYKQMRAQLEAETDQIMRSPVRLMAYMRGN